MSRSRCPAIRDRIPASTRVLVAAVLLGLAPTDARAQDPAPTAESVLADLSLEQRAAQLITCWTLSRVDDDYPRRDELRRWVDDPGIGGVVISLGEVDDAAALVTDLQARADVPLLVAADFEGGVAFRLDGTATALGLPMLWGAANSSVLARAAGRVTATESAALGVHWVFAPVLDVNSNPANPIINVRSFGASPELVARLGTAFTLGCQAHGALATGKHFPGHGDVDTDSHLALPTVPGDRARLDAVELAPFRAAIDAGIASLMTGHLAVPGLGLAPDRPATMAPELLTTLLRERFGFDGLVVTDALDMGAIADPNAAAVAALVAGADVLLMPPDPLACRDAVIAAVRDGRLAASRVDEAALRVLRAKQRVGLLAGGGRPRDADARRALVAAHAPVAAALAVGGVTLARDPGGRVPLGAAAPRVVVLLPAECPADVGGAIRAALVDALGTERIVTVTDADDAAARDAAAAARDAIEDRSVPLVSLSFHRADRARHRLQGLEDLLGSLASRADHVAVLFGDPYAIDHVHPDASLVFAWHATSSTERAVADLLLGRGAAFGRSPIPIPGRVERGDGISRWPTGPLERATPAQQGFAPDLVDRVVDVLEAGVADRAFPGAVAMVARRGQIVAEVAVGRHTYAEDARPTGLDDRFDLASLTKVTATTPVLLRLIAAGALTLDTPVVALVPEFTGGGKDAVTIRHLLTHTAGLPPFRRFFASHHGAHAVLCAAVAEPLATRPGTAYRYSDIGMMLAMLCAERAGGLPFAWLCAREVFEPLGMDGATFANGTDPLDAVPTEDCAWRGEVVVGRVHDENAFAMGGVSGHAGLFATAADVTHLAQAFLGGGGGWLPPGLVDAAIRPAQVIDGSSRALGWDTFRPGGSGGAKLSPRAFGHTGFTGTSIWCDPARDLSIVLLGNRVHPSRDNRGHIGVRRALADTVVDALIDDPLR